MGNFFPDGAVNPDGPEAESYVEEFAAAATWTVNHNLGRIPKSCSVLNAAGFEIEVSVQHVSENQTIVSFDLPTAGTVRLS